jgi:putative hydrolase of the HAD superfamily
MSQADLSKMIESKSVVLFDLFHTLTSLESTWDGSRPFTSDMLGISREEWDRQLIACSRDRVTGRKTDPVEIVAGMAHAVNSTIPMDLIRRATENRIARFAASLVHMPQETRDVLAELKRRGKRIGLISNADVMEVSAWRECPVCDLFDATVFSCHVGCAKPEPGIYEMALRQLGARPPEAAFVGDGGSDELRGARAMGITTVMITGIIRELWPERIPLRRKDADFVIERLGELLT